MSDIFKHIINQAHILYSRVPLVIKQQRKDIIMRGKRAIFVKLYHVIISIVLLIPALIGLVLMRLLRPFVLVRFGQLYTARIGNLVSWVVVYLYECSRSANPGTKKIDIFYYSYPICNRQMLLMWRRILRVPRAPFLFNYIRRLNQAIPHHEKHVILIEQKLIKSEEYYSRMATPILFTAEEEIRGKDMLKKMGILNGSQFVCFHARDCAYLHNLFPIENFNYHDFRDADVDNYRMMAEKLTERGYFVIRMGAKVKKPLVTDNPKIIDYATLYRSDFLDIYLSAKCHFFIGCTSGIDEIPKLFKRPVLYVNTIPMGEVPVGGVAPLFIPKKLWLKTEKRFLTFCEIFNSKLSLLSDAQEYQRIGIEVRENTPEEISALALEMDEILNGNWAVTDEEDELQERFKTIYRTFDPRLEVKTRIGREFILRNKELLRLQSNKVTSMNLGVMPCA